jgi:predicted nucleic acid-binding protein
MIVVSDTTPLRYLAALGQLEILPRLFGSVYCPEAVMQECRHPRAPAALRMWAEAPPSWLVIDALGDIEPSLLASLDAGEAAAITLATRLKAQVILIDEQAGRRCAQSHGFVTAGTLNILAQAAILGWLDYPATVARLRQETNFRTTQAVIDSAWQSAQPSQQR